MSNNRLESLLLRHSDYDDCPRSVCAGAQRQQKRPVLLPSHEHEKPLRVLVADDNADVADSFAVLIKYWGHDAQSAYDGAAALEIADVYQPDVMLLDIAMPGINGFQLAQRLRNQPRFKDTLLMAITGYADRAHRRLWQAAFDHFLIKPVEPAVLKELLRRAQAQRERSGLSLSGANHG
jgi:CheY-like chemotaxis protein